MDNAQHTQSDRSGAEVVDFEQALLDSLPRRLRTELLAEARILAQAFSAPVRAQEMETTATALSLGRHDDEMDRRRARGLAAALRRLAREERG